MSCQGLLRERTGGLHHVSPLIPLVLQCNVWTLGAPSCEHHGVPRGCGVALLMHILPKKFPTEIPTVPPPGTFLCPPANKVGKSGLSILTLVSKYVIMNYKLIVHMKGPLKDILFHLSSLAHSSLSSAIVSFNPSLP